MASSTPATKPEDAQAPATIAPPARIPWWRQWLEPAVAGAIISALVIALVSIGVAGFQSLKGDIRDGEARLSQQIEVVKLDLKAGSVATETGLRKDLKKSKRLLKKSAKSLENGNQASNPWETNSRKAAWYRPKSQSGSGVWRVGWLCMMMSLMHTWRPICAPAGR